MCIFALYLSTKKHIMIFSNLSPKEAAKKLEREGKKVITLIIKQVYFDQIMDGTKTHEYREVKPSTIKKLLAHDENGDLIGSGKFLQGVETIQTVHYDAMLLYVGYNPLRDSALVEITASEEQLLCDEDGKVVKIKDDDGSEWTPSQVDFSLGKVLSKDVYKR